MSEKPIQIRRPEASEWDRILEILRTANFHHIGGPEMPTFPLSDCFVAEFEGKIVGVGGYRMLDETTAKTTLLAVDPDYRHTGAGRALQLARQAFVKAQGAKRLYTNSDDERVINWYRRNFGYELTGKRIPKLAPFGRDDRDEWVNMVLEL